jgi:hypothetical protein
LARWAGKRELILRAPQGVALGWANGRAFGPKIRGQRQQFQQVFALLDQLFSPPSLPRKAIGFHTKEADKD